MKSYFQTLCEEKTISKAAVKLYISRQALSTSLKKLEDEIGDKLFIRKKDGLELTETGHQLQECIVDMDARWYAFLRQVRGDAPETIRIGMTSVAFDLDDFNNIYKIGKSIGGINIEIVDLQGEKYIEMMEKNNLDMFYSSVPYRSKKIDSCQLSDDEMVLLVSEQHPLACKDVIDFQTDIHGETFLITEGERTEVYEQAFAHTDSTYRLLRDNKNILQMQIINNLGICWTTGSIADVFVIPGVIKKKLKNSPKIIQTYIVYRKDLSAKGSEVLRKLMDDYLNGHSANTED